MQAVGVDLGFGAVKAVWHGGKAVFPSVWSEAPEGDASSWGLAGAPAPLEVDGRRVIVGPAADRLPGAHRPFGDGRLADPEALPLLGAALWAAGVQGDVSLGSGTPLGRFGVERDAARQALEGRTLRLSCDGHQTTVRIARLVLRPQGVGAALWLLTRDLLPADGLGVVVDVGTRTTDVVVLDLADASPVVPLCFSVAVGVATAAESLAAGAEGNWPPPVDLCIARLRGQSPTWHGQALPEPGPHLDRLAGTLRADIQRRIGDAAGRVSALALVGGGSVLLGDRLHDALPGSVVHLSAEEAVLANAEGYRAAAQHSDQW